jgi:hypothetical protein
VIHHLSRDGRVEMDLDLLEQNSHCDRLHLAKGILSECPKFGSAVRTDTFVDSVDLAKDPPVTCRERSSKIPLRNITMSVTWLRKSGQASKSE